MPAWWNECAALPNSTGRAASISIVGSLNLQASDATLFAPGLPASIMGQFLIGREPSNLPFGAGLLCIDPFAGIYRVPGLRVSDQGGVAALPIPFAQLISQLGFSPGTPWRFQLWFRDSVGAGMNLSDAAAALFCP